MDPERLNIIELPSAFKEHLVWTTAQLYMVLDRHVWEGIVCQIATALE